MGKKTKTKYILTLKNQNPLMLRLILTIGIKTKETKQKMRNTLNGTIGNKQILTGQK